MSEAATSPEERVTVVFAPGPGKPAGDVTMSPLPGTVLSTQFGPLDQSPSPLESSQVSAARASGGVSAGAAAAKQAPALRRGRSRENDRPAGRRADACMISFPPTCT